LIQELETLDMKTTSEIYSHGMILVPRTTQDLASQVEQPGHLWKTQIQSIHSIHLLVAAQHTNKGEHDGKSTN